LEQVHFAVQHGAPSELAGLGGSGARGDEGRKRGGGYDQPAVCRYLHEIIAGVGVWRPKTGGETIVDGLAGIGMQEARAKRGARWRRMERLEAAGGDGECIATRKAD
jgi:hypothetical protein